MIERPCKPDADVKWLWRVLLPTMPPPACDMAKDQSAGPIDEAAYRDPNARKPAGKSWFGKLWPQRSQSK
jgi:hypothetical protein